MNILQDILHPTITWDAAGEGSSGAGGDTGNPSGTGEGGDTPANPFAELDEATRTWVNTRHGNDVAKLAQQAYELDKFAGSAVAIPKDDDADAWDKVFSRLGRPESSDKYELTVPENLPETVPYDEEMAKGFKDQAHELGLSQKQAASLHDWFAGQMTEQAAAMQDTMGTNLETDISKANEALEAVWGAKDGETWKANLEMAARFFDAIDEKGNLTDVLSKRGLLGPDREVLVPELATAFAKAGIALFTEGGTLNGAGDSLTGVNPFAGEGNLTAIMQLVKEQPDKAKQLARAAGADLSLYGLS